MMPSSPNYKRNYKQEKKTSDARGEKKKRAARNRARLKVANSKGVKPTRLKGDVSHKDNNTSNNSRSNLTVESPAKNRSFKRTKTARRKKK
jgi:hypothetical protein